MEGRRRSRRGKISEQTELSNPPIRRFSEKIKEPGKSVLYESAEGIRKGTGKPDEWRGNRIQEGKTKKRKVTEKTVDKKTFKIGYWNVAGLLNKDIEFWNCVKERDIIELVEIWIEEKQWKGIRGKLPQEFNWKCKYAVREKKKEGVIGGIITGVRKGIEKNEMEEEETFWQERRIKMQNEKWKILTVYSKEMKTLKEELEQRLKEEELQKLIIEGDFNARIGLEESDEEQEKKKDKVKNAEGKLLMELIEENGWNILNGNAEGGEEDEYTYVGPRGCTVIDYVITNYEAKEEVKRFQVGERIRPYAPNYRTLQSNKNERKAKKRGEGRRGYGWMKEKRNFKKKLIKSVLLRRE